MKRLLLILGLVSLLGAACADPSSRASGEAIFGTWVVSEINGEKVVEGAEPTLEFSEEGTLSGSTGCNHYSAKFTLKGEALSLDMMAVTERGCFGPVNDQEQSFLSILNKVTRISHEGENELLLKASDDAVIKAKKS